VEPCLPVAGQGAGHRASMDTQTGGGFPEVFYEYALYEGESGFDSHSQGQVN